MKTWLKIVIGIIGIYLALIIVGNVYGGNATAYGVVIAAGIIVICAWLGFTSVTKKKLPATAKVSK